MTSRNGMKVPLTALAGSLLAALLLTTCCHGQDMPTPGKPMRPPLRSLVLGVKVDAGKAGPIQGNSMGHAFWSAHGLGEGSLELYIEGGLFDAGWYTVGPTPVALGRILLPDAGEPAKIERTDDWSAAKAIATFGNGATLALSASQLSPGVLLETSTTGLRLFAGI